MRFRIGLIHLMGLEEDEALMKYEGQEGTFVQVDECDQVHLLMQDGTTQAFIMQDLEEVLVQ